MLKSQYSRNIVGQNYIALIQGILSLKSNHSTLLINDSNSVFANQWYLNIGYCERAILSQLGVELSIDALTDIDSYLVEQNTLLYLNQKLLEMGGSPYINIKEIARKIPECFSDIFIEKLDDLDPQIFDQKFFELLDHMAKNSLDNEEFKLSELFSNLDHQELQVCLDGFKKFVESDSLIAKQIHFVNQVLFQTVFSSGFQDLESSYLFLSLISPRYKIDEASLCEELLYEYRLLGGDLKTANIDAWGIKNQKLEYVQLNSIDGNVKVEKTYFFGQDSHLLPFESRIEKVVFKSIYLSCQLEHDFIEYFKHKRIVFAPQNRMGSDFPFWEITINESGELFAIYSYADYQGTKPSFYYPQALDDIYGSLKTILPGVVKSDWVSRSQLVAGDDIWFEFESSYKNKLSPSNAKSYPMFNRLKIKGDKDVLLDGIEHCGPGRGRSLGLFSYLLDVFSAWKESKNDSIIEA